MPGSQSSRRRLWAWKIHTRAYSRSLAHNVETQDASREGIRSLVEEKLHGW